MEWRAEGSKPQNESGHYPSLVQLSWQGPRPSRTDRNEFTSSLGGGSSQRWWELKQCFYSIMSDLLQASNGPSSDDTRLKDANLPSFGNTAWSHSNRMADPIQLILSCTVQPPPFLAHPNHGTVRTAAAVVRAKARERCQAPGCFCWSVIWCGNQRDGGVVFRPDSDEGMKCSGGGQHELTGRRLHFVLFLPLGFKDTDMQH